MLYDVPAPAKVNLFLHVVGRRADGYHLLQSVFQFIDLADTLHFDLRADGVISRSVDVPGVTEQDDLTLRAARALKQAAGVTAGADITLVKQIPTGGGLGGGSSDAATTLIALNRLWGCGLSRQALMKIGLTLGADVPVFIFGRTAFAEGIGEQLTAVDVPARAFVVAQPQCNVPTSEIFRAPDLTRDSNSIRITDFVTHPSAAFGRNDLESVAFRLYPKIRTGVETLRRNVNAVLAAEHAQHSGEVKREVKRSSFEVDQGKVGASENAQQDFAPVVRMSGSGACVFVQCRDMAQAVQIKQEVVREMHATMQVGSEGKTEGFRLVQACPGLTEHPLLNWIAT